MKRIGLSYRAKLTLLVFVLSLIPFTGAAAFFLNLYRREKLATLFEGVLSNTLQGSARLENTLAIARITDFEKADSLRDVLILADDPCGTPRVYVARHFSSTLQRLGLNADKWLSAATLRSTCASLPPHMAKDAVTVLSSWPESLGLPFPYLAAVQEGPRGPRFLLISMDAVGAISSDNAVLLVDKVGKIVWQDGLNGGSVPPAIDEFMKKNLAVASPSVTRVGGQSIVAYAPVQPNWVLFSTTSEDAALAPVRFVLKQSLLLALGSMFFYLLIGKSFATMLARPLKHLREAAENLARGDLTTRIVPEGRDEVTVVQETFNSMAQQIQALIQKTKANAEMEADIAIAQKVQVWFFPERGISVSGHQLHGYVKMAQKCGGDWWGYVEVPRPGKSPVLTLLIGDAAGHGISSALVTAAVQGAMAILNRWTIEAPERAADPATVLRLLNDVVFETSGGEVHMSFLVAVLDPDQNIMTVGNAGHNKPYLMMPTRLPGGKTDIRPVGGASPVLGIKKDEQFTNVTTYPWEEGAQLFLYTDGLIDPGKAGADLFGRRALVQELDRLSRMKGPLLLEGLLAARHKKLGAEIEDDITLVICSRPFTPKRAPSPEGAKA